ncbi:MAG: DUF1351 domain-containing protein [Clostridium sp.]|nr:DUF1351 domain-containing protein [Clostridium sp.]
MELKIYSPQEGGFAQPIQWNFAELKQEIAEVVQGYEVSIYTEDMIPQAKTDRAKLRKFVDAIDTKRKEVKKKYMEPYEQFEREAKELINMVQKAIDNIDSQVKAVEERKREEKTAKIREFYDDNIYDLGQYLPFEKVFRLEYANATTSMKSIKQEILDKIQMVAEGLAILNEVDSKFAGDMKAVFLKTYDIGLAMAERNRLEQEEKRREEYMAEQQRRKEEREARTKAEAQQVMSAGVKSPEPVSAPVEMVAPAAASKAAEKIHVIDFRVHATMAQLDALKAFLNDKGIRFEPVPGQ